MGQSEELAAESAKSDRLLGSKKLWINILKAFLFTAATRLRKNPPVHGLLTTLLGSSTMAINVLALHAFSLLDFY